MGMTPYATWTGTKRNLKALREADWSILTTPDVLRRNAWRAPLWDDGTPAPYVLDNGAWGCHQRGKPFDAAQFERAVAAVGEGARWIVLPDIVGGGEASLEFSLKWIERLRHFPLMLAVQDGMTISDVSDIVGYFGMGIFVGGTTDWKLSTLPSWGNLAQRHKVRLHVARVNSVRRIRLCAAAGADSFDGTSATRFSVNVPRLTAAARQ
jgi:hypothetical protein